MQSLNAKQRKALNEALRSHMRHWNSWGAIFSCGFCEAHSKYPNPEPLYHAEIAHKEDCVGLVLQDVLKEPNA